MDGNILSEPYVSPAASLQPHQDQSLSLPPSAYFVLGDARDDSLDSRSFGPVREEEIVLLPRPSGFGPRTNGGSFIQGDIFLVG